SVLFALVAVSPVGAQRGATSTGARGNNGASQTVPRMPDGHPDLSGVWWPGSDIGGRRGGPGGGPGAAGGGGGGGRAANSLCKLVSALGSGKGEDTGRQRRSDTKMRPSCLWDVERQSVQRGRRWSDRPNSEVRDNADGNLSWFPNYPDRRKETP